MFLFIVCNLYNSNPEDTPPLSTLEPVIYSAVIKKNDTKVTAKISAFVDNVIAHIITCTIKIMTLHSCINSSACSLYQVDIVFIISLSISFT